ncbi:MAG: calcium/sodium antiporter [Rhizobiales bacterium]|nr:calcium/sodium antiporter [Hyphomicrobiales bacterium]
MNAEVEIITSMMSYLTLLAGLGILLFCGDLLVRGAIGLAEKLGIPAIIIGLTVVAFGTSAPEMVVSVRAALAGAPGIAVGNVVGSNIANILLVLGLPAIISATQCNQPLVARNAFYVLGASLLFTAMCFAGPLTTWHGVVLLVLLFMFLFVSGKAIVDEPCREETQEEIDAIEGVVGVPHSNFVMIAFLVVGLIGLPIGAHFTVEGAQVIARAWNVSEAAIGLTVIALGTTLPELVTALIAVKRGECGLALGNVLGSNLFNILAIMGVTAVVTPIEIPEQILHMDLWVMIAVTLLVFPFALGHFTLTRLPALAFVAAYIAYLAFAISPHMEATMSDESQSNSQNLSYANNALSGHE